MKTLIIEDELHAQQLLSQIITEYCPDITIVGYAENVTEGIEIINRLRPDLVFCDVELGSKQSFEILDKVSYRNFYTVFTTAFDHYAFKAFEYEALAYILKPYVPDDVIRATQKAKSTHHVDTVYAQFNKLGKISDTQADMVSISTREGIARVSIKDIVSVQADRSYCYVYLNNGDRLCVTKPLKDLETILPPSSFFRSHSSYLININHVKKYLKEDGGAIIMGNDTHIPLSRRRRSMFLSLL